MDYFHSEKLHPFLSDGREAGGVGVGREAHERGHAAVRKRGGGLLQCCRDVPPATQYGHRPHARLREARQTKETASA